LFSTGVIEKGADAGISSLQRFSNVSKYSARAMNAGFEYVREGVAFVDRVRSFHVLTGLSYEKLKNDQLLTVSKWRINNA
jgi:hypothetical protein